MSSHHVEMDEEMCVCISLCLLFNGKPFSIGQTARARMKVPFI